MPGRKKPAKPIYQRGKYRLYPPREDRTSYTIIWYDPERRRERSLSTGTTDLGDASKQVDRKYHESQGSSFCPTCGQRVKGATSPLVVDAIERYMASKGLTDEASAIKYRLQHVVDYVTTNDLAATTTHQVDEVWIQRFREWLAKKPVRGVGGAEKERSISTIENSVLQLAAAINYADDHGARFKPIPAKEVNRTPLYRASVDTLAAMFAYATEYPSRLNLLNFIRLSVLTLGRPDAVLEATTDPARDQWHPAYGIFNLNPRGRRQTRKYRATVPIARQGVDWLKSLPHGPIITVNSVRKAWDTMAAEIGLPGDRESGSKLIRRSMAEILRGRMRSTDWTELEVFLGHKKFDSVSELYAPTRPDYLANAKATIEQVIDEIEAKVPNAFHRADTAPAPRGSTAKAA